MNEDSSFRNLLYNIMHLDNIPSIIQQGILCYKLAAPLEHKSLALEEVQTRRENKHIPQGKKLHDYANLYFNPRNPMMYKIRARYAELCVLAIDAQVLKLPGVVVSDMNAARDMCKFLDPEAALESLDFKSIYLRVWYNPDDAFETDRLRGILCPEALIPEKVPYEYVLSAYVADLKTGEKLRSLMFTKQIICDPDMFFKER